MRGSVRQRFASGIPDFIALRGDASDKIPGAKGVGPKTAAGLIVKYIGPARILVFLGVLGRFLLPLLRRLASLDGLVLVLRVVLLRRRHETLPFGYKAVPREDVTDLIGYMQDLAAKVKKAAAEGKCMDTAMKKGKLPKYEKWANYATFLPLNVERYCYLNNGF
jgi:5'-3' exonuclease